MAKTKDKPRSVKLEEGERINEPHYNEPHYLIPVAAQSYSNIAAVLAGFAFAAVILAVQTTPPLDPEKAIFKDWATIAFLLSFVGCVISAFIFAMVTGEHKLYPRSYAMALLGGAGFSISASLVIFGMVLLTKVFLSPKVYGFAHNVFPVIMIFSILFVAMSALDPILTFDSKPVTKKDLAQLFIPGLTPYVLAWVIFYFLGGFISDATFNVAMWGAIVIILLSAVGSLIISSIPNTKFRFNMLTSGMIVGVHSIALGLFLMML